MSYSNKTKVVLLTGGLGNQIFQYAFGLYLEQEFGLNIKYCFQNTTSKKAAKRSFALDNLYDIAHYSSKLLHTVNNYKLFKFLIFKFSWCAKMFGIMTEDNFKKLPKDKPDLNNYKYFIGYWQESLYLNRNLEKLKAFKDPKINFKVVKKEVFSSNNEYIALHIRRGDYLNLSSIYKIIENDYYRSALNYIYRCAKKPILLLFSDDKDASKRLSEEIAFDVKIIDYKDLDDVEEFRLMTACDHFITANSTFSFLAAKLSYKKNSIKITPKHWFVSNNEKMIKDRNFIYL